LTKIKILPEDVRIFFLHRRESRGGRVKKVYNKKKPLCVPVSRVLCDE
jgi:hypothetical protein